MCPYGRKAIFILFILLFMLTSCEAQGALESRPELCVASWNVQNLFDARLDGHEYDDYKPSATWTEKAYQLRLERTRTVLGYLPKCNDYIIVLNEIEGPQVVEDLVSSHDIVDMGLCWYACAGEIDGAINTAVVSSQPIVSAKIHEVGEGLRPVLEVGLEVCGNQVFVLAVHFKSNIGDVVGTAQARLEAAKVVAQVSANLERDNPGCLVLVCGDMNEQCWDLNCMGPASPLVVDGSFQRGRWYCFWMDNGRSLWPNGSYLYDGSWRSYDNILVSLAGQDGSGLELSDAGVIFKGIIRTADSRPFAWNRSLLTGVSDHLPVWTIFSSI